MNNTGKLLRAFIEASGYEVEEVKREALAGEGPDVFILDKNYIIDYKVTRREVDMESFFSELLKQQVTNEKTT